MELFHHAGALGHHDDPKTKTQGTYRPSRQGARRLRAPQGEVVPSGVYALRCARLREQRNHRAAADARSRQDEEISNPARQEMVGE